MASLSGGTSVVKTRLFCNCFRLDRLERLPKKTGSKGQVLSYNNIPYGMHVPICAR